MRLGLYPLRYVIQSGGLGPRAGEHQPVLGEPDLEVGQGATQSRDGLDIDPWSLLALGVVGLRAVAGLQAASNGVARGCAR